MLFGGSDFLFPLKQSQDTTTYWRFTFPEHYETQTLTLLEHNQTLLEASSDYFITTIRQGPVVYVHVQGGRTAIGTMVDRRGLSHHSESTSTYATGCSAEAGMTMSQPYWL